MSGLCGIGCIHLDQNPAQLLIHEVGAFREVMTSHSEDSSALFLLQPVVILACIFCLLFCMIWLILLCCLLAASASTGTTLPLL